MKKKHLLLLTIFLSIYCYSQTDCVSFWSENNPQTHLWLENDSLFINQGSEDIAEDVVLVSATVFKGSYRLKNDSLIVLSGGKKFIFRVIKEGILESTFQVSGFMNKKDKFYCSRFMYKNGELLMGSQWKNNQKDGKWIYLTKQTNYSV